MISHVVNVDAETDGLKLAKEATSLIRPLDLSRFTKEQ
jgi:hypothetical protein